MIKKGDNGYILITTLLLLLVLTVVGLAAIGTSTLENMLSGNIRLRERNIAKADGAIEISTEIIEQALGDDNTQNFANITDLALLDDLDNPPFDNDNCDSSPDITFTIDTHDINVDIDKMYKRQMPGSSIEFASGAEGGGRAFIIFFRINSCSEDIRDSSADVGAIYRYVPPSM
jgi:Tfp pilus assembly protein PilX